ncbi:D-amino acid aminotransferase [Methylovorus sp. MP688]|uniref:D-amino acid aminotransferase n=1 Tax=Methylovorus sp. (strain MP688) TaxID=887061 RepID=UPI0001EC4E19|nr:D-amino acid aminotransferase [Methylovorus sp. MP688]ADQ85630.1 aminotransferase class IV [Methylovorus sp. MP688]
MSQIVYLNGAFMPIEEARIPVLDRGFIFGDGVYELIPVYSRHPFRLQEHLRRLSSSLSSLRIPNLHDSAAWSRHVEELVKRNEAEDQSIYIQVTRGPAPRDHAFPAHVEPTVFMMSNPLITPPASLVESGAVAISSQDIRWDHCDIKAISLLPNVLLRQMAVDEGAVETILFRDGMLTEGAASNIFAVDKGVILAPPKDQHMLPGITYDVILELAESEGIPVDIGYFTEARIRSADELWMTSSTKEILPIVRLDNTPIANGLPGPIFKRMYKAYQLYKNHIMRSAETPHG